MHSTCLYASLVSLFTGAKEAKFPYFSKGKPVFFWLILKSSDIVLYKSLVCTSNSWPAFCFVLSPHSSLITQCRRPTSFARTASAYELDEARGKCLLRMKWIFFQKMHEFTTGGLYSCPEAVWGTFSAISLKVWLRETMLIIVIFLSAVSTNSDGSHSLQRIHCWESDVHFSKSVLMEKHTPQHLGMPEGELHLQKMYIIGWAIPLRLFSLHIFFRQQTEYSILKICFVLYQGKTMLSHDQLLCILQDYLYSAFYNTIIAKQLYTKLSLQ